MASRDRASRGRRTEGSHRNRRDTDRVVQWLRAGAVAAGIGAAVINGQGIAAAEPETDTNVSDTDTPTDKPVGKTEPSASATSAPSLHGADTGEDTGEMEVAPDHGTSLTRTVTSPNSPPVSIDAQTTVIREDDADDEEQDAVGDGAPDDVQSVEHHIEPDEDRSPIGAIDGARPTYRNNEAPDPLRRLAVTKVVDTLDGGTGGDDQDGVHASAHAVARVLAAPTTGVITTPPLSLPQRPPTATAAVTEVAPTPTIEVRPIRALVLKILSVFGYTPGMPNNPLGELIWGAFRRIESTFANERPSAGAATVTGSSLTDEGQVNITGRVDFDDYDDDPLTYSSTNGAHGTVTVAPDGTFTYTPTDPTYTGTDTFTVTARDTGFHLHGIASLFAPDRGHTRTAAVTLTLTAADNAAPVVDDVASDPGTGNTWTVTVNASDPDGDDVVVTVTPVDTGKVTVTPVSGQPGTFTVVVTDSAWATANPAKQVLVNVTVTDGVSATQPTTLAIGTVSNVIAVGLNYQGTLDIPALPAGVHYTQISSGANTVLLRSDGVVVAFGNNTYGQLDIPDPPAGLTYTQVSAGAQTALLLSDGTVVVVGELPAVGPIVVPPLPAGLTYTQVTASNGYVALLRSDGNVITLGRNLNSTLPSVTVPPLPAGVTYTQVSAGGNHLALLRSDGKVVDVLYNGNVVTRTPPNGTSYTQISSGSAAVVMLRSDGKAEVYSQLGVGTSVPALPPNVVYTEVVSGSLHQVFLRSDGTAVAANGPNDYGQNVIPTLPDGVVITQIAGGYRSTILLTAVDGQPTAHDDALDASEDTPRVIAPSELLANDVNPDGKPLVITSVWGATKGSTALAADGTITYTPNANYHGVDTFTYLASDGNLADYATVTITIASVDDPTVIRSVTSTPGIGNTWTVVVDAVDPDDDGLTFAVVPQGAAGYTVTSPAGQPNTFVITANPEWVRSHPGDQVQVNVSVTGTGAVTTVKAIGTLSNATVTGVNTYGQQDIPALPAGVTYIRAAAGDGHVVLLRSDGKAIAVGSNSYGQLNIPAPEAGVTYTHVAAGTGFTALLRTDGRVVLVGNPPGLKPIPELPVGMTYTDVSVFGDNVALLRSDGSVYGSAVGDTWYPSPTTELYRYRWIYAGHDRIVAEGYFAANEYGASGQTELLRGAAISRITVTEGHTVFTFPNGSTLVMGTVPAAYGETTLPALPPGAHPLDRPSWQEISGSEHDLVLLRSDGQVFAIGRNAGGQNVIAAPAAGTVYTAIAAGNTNHVLLIGYQPESDW